MTAPELGNLTTMVHKNKKIRVWLAGFVFFASLHLCVLTAYRISRNAAFREAVTADDLIEQDPKRPIRQETASSASPRNRVIYPNSVIRGGVRTAEEFNVAVLKDSVVAAHFADFGTARSRIVDLKAEQEAYVSYRMSDMVYWTKKKVKLAKGELMITDGVNYARARCGNRIAGVSQTPTSDEEPKDALLDTPIATEDRDPLLLTMPKPADVPPDAIRPSTFVALPGSRPRPLGFFIPGIIGGTVAGRVFRPGSDSDFPAPPVGSAPNPLPTADVPEPNTLLFLATGLGSAITFWRTRKRR